MPTPTRRRNAYVDNDGTVHRVAVKRGPLPRFDRVLLHAECTCSWKGTTFMAPPGARSDRQLAPTTQACAREIRAHLDGLP